MKLNLVDNLIGRANKRFMYELPTNIYIVDYIMRGETIVWLFVNTIYVVGVGLG